MSPSQPHHHHLHEQRLADVFWYEPGVLPEEHEQQLEKMREALAADGKLAKGLDDRLSLLRFLKARQWCVHRAVKMYEAMAAWRQEHGVDQVFGYEFDELPSVKRWYPHFYHKTDKFGRPCYYELLGHIDIEELLKVTTMDRFLTYHVQQCESFRRIKLPACSAAAGRTVLTQTIILDMAGLSATRHFTRLVLRFLERLSSMDQNNFPEHLGCMFMINTPFIFRGFWALIKQFLDERTLAKIKVLGSSYHEELLSVIPAEALPTMFGGSSRCDEHVDVGPWQEPAVVSRCPELIKAAAAGGDCLERSKSSMIGTGLQLAAEARA